MFVIGVTGGIGCGKSTVSNICREYGLPVIDADEISRNVTASHGTAIQEIEDTFGKKVIAEDGSLHRKAMSDMVFKNKKSLDLLSSIVHKYVIEEIRNQVEKYRTKNCKAIILDVPIPVKNGFIDLCDQIWVVWADDDLRINRLNQRGMSAKDAGRRILSQMTKEQYEAIADKIILNNNSLESLEEEVKKLLDEELHMRGIKCQII
jgi:dephospho-CoA kinase